MHAAPAHARDNAIFVALHRTPSQLAGRRAVGVRADPAASGHGSGRRLGRGLGLGAGGPDVRCSRLPGGWWPAEVGEAERPTQPLGPSPGRPAGTDGTAARSGSAVARLYFLVSEALTRTVHQLV